MEKDGHVVVAGAGIVGLAIARAFTLRGFRVTVLEKESRIARHQTSRNSGVIHTGPYYKPGSLKAQLCVSGGNSLKAYAREKGLEHAICGKLIVATTDSHAARIDEIYRRATLNGVKTEIVSGTRIREIEPECISNYGLFVAGTGIIDYSMVAESFAEDVKSFGGSMKFNAAVTLVKNYHPTVLIEHTSGVEKCDFFINATGLHSDNIARLSGLRPSVKIIPFKGQYFEVDEEKSGLVRSMVYPAPDPTMPFLGVHITRSLEGTLHAGPNAILAFGREAYGKWEMDPKHLREVMLFPGFWRFLSANRKYAVREGLRSASKKKFAAELGSLIEGIDADDLKPALSGIRAQAMTESGQLSDDFVIQRNGNQIHILNAPSPAATASMSIAEWIVERALENS